MTMNIERTNACDGPVLPDGAKKPLRSHLGPGDAMKAADNPDAVAGSEFQDLVGQAANVPDVNAQAVAEAKRLLKSSELSSPEAISRAAEAMLRRGI
jgi:hypothetical protein